MPLTPPENVQPFVDVLGEDGTVTFLLEFGGAKMTFSRRPHEDGRLARAIGIEAIVQLCHEALPTRVPTAKPWIARVLHERGWSIDDIARKLHSSDTSVRRWLRGDRPGVRGFDRQLDLF